MWHELVTTESFKYDRTAFPMFLTLSSTFSEFEILDFVFSMKLLNLLSNS